MSGGPVKQMEDVVETPRIVLIGVISLLVFGVGIVWAVTIQERAIGTLVSKPLVPVAHAHEREVGLVFHPMFTTVPLAAKEIEEQKAALEGWGYTDGAHQHARIPVEQAMELYAKGAKW
jgi:hypothetical protein